MCKNDYLLISTCYSFVCDYSSIRSMSYFKVEFKSMLRSNQDHFKERYSYAGGLHLNQMRSCVLFLLLLHFSFAVVELTEPSWRPFFGSIGSIIYSFGYMLIPGLAYAIRDYQKLLLVHPCFCILPLTYYWLVYKHLVSN